MRAWAAGDEVDADAYRAEREGRAVRRSKDRVAGVRRRG
jgi:hypothetical protein